MAGFKLTPQCAYKIVHLTLQLEMMSTSVTATGFGSQPPFLFRHLTNLPHSSLRR